MKTLYYRGQPYQFEISEVLGKRYFVLYKNASSEKRLLIFEAETESE